MIYLVIPFRKGSKRIPHKNIKLLNKKPLFLWTYIQALKIKEKYDDEVQIILKTDYVEKFVKAIISEHNLKLNYKFFKVDETKDDELANVYLDKITKRMQDTDIIVLLQPTAPLRNVIDIDTAIEIHKDTQLNVISVCNIGSPGKLYRNKGGILTSENTSITAAKNIKPLYRRNSSIYIFTVGSYREEATIFTQRTAFYEMPHLRSIDIDTMDDFKLAEIISKGAK